MHLGEWFNKQRTAFIVRRTGVPLEQIVEELPEWGDRWLKRSERKKRSSLKAIVCSAAIALGATYALMKGDRIWSGDLVSPLDETIPVTVTYDEGITDYWTGFPSKNVMSVYDGDTLLTLTDRTGEHNLAASAGLDDALETVRTERNGVVERFSVHDASGVTARAAYARAVLAEKTELYRALREQIKKGIAAGEDGTHVADGTLATWAAVRALPSLKIDEATEPAQLVSSPIPYEYAKKLLSACVERECVGVYIPSTRTLEILTSGSNGDGAQYDEERFAQLSRQYADLVMVHTHPSADGDYFILPSASDTASHLRTDCQHLLNHPQGSFREALLTTKNGGMLLVDFTYPNPNGLRKAIAGARTGLGSHLPEFCDALEQRVYLAHDAASLWSEDPATPEDEIMEFNAQIPYSRVRVLPLGPLK